MAAEIYPFPKRQTRQAVAKSIDLQHCWDRRLNNPYLNSLYKGEISYAERWYLQVVHHLNLEEIDHPLVNLLLNKQDYTLNLLLMCVEHDLKIHINTIDKLNIGNHYTMAAEYNIRRLNRWRTKWQGLIKYRENLSYKI